MSKDTLDKEKKVTKKVASTKKKTVAKENTAKPTSSKKANTKSSVKKSSTTKSVTAKKTSSEKAISPVKKKTTKVVTKTNSKKTTSSKKGADIFNIEYYDLPYRYNQTLVKILAQTPSKLFIYWDISDSDRLKYIETYGENFFNTTKPILIIHNQTKNYSFELEINDFANSWYVNVNDADCKYTVELGRRPIQFIPEIPDNYIYISSSNYMDLPNDHILFDRLNQNSIVSFKNVKTDQVSSKEFGSLTFYKNYKNICNIYDLYKKMYKDEINNLSLTNPSSSSWF